MDPADPDLDLKHCIPVLWYRCILTYCPLHFSFWKVDPDPSFQSFFVNSHLLSIWYVLRSPFLFSWITRDFIVYTIYQVLPAPFSAFFFKIFLAGYTWATGTYGVRSVVMVWYCLMFHTVRLIAKNHFFPFFSACSFFCLTFFIYLLGRIPRQESVLKTFYQNIILLFRGSDSHLFCFKDRGSEYYFLIPKQWNFFIRTK
jgi:hypothetical protein